MRLRVTNRAGRRLRAAGRRSGHAAGFLELSEEEAAFVKLKPASGDHLRRRAGRTLGRSPKWSQ